MLSRGTETHLIKKPTLPRITKSNWKIQLFYDGSKFRWQINTSGTSQYFTLRVTFLRSRFNTQQFLIMTTVN